MADWSHLRLHPPRHIKRARNHSHCVSVYSFFFSLIKSFIGFKVNKLSNNVWFISGFGLCLNLSSCPLNQYFFCLWPLFWDYFSICIYLSIFFGSFFPNKQDNNARAYLFQGEINIYLACVFAGIIWFGLVFSILTKKMLKRALLGSTYVLSLFNVDCIDWHLLWKFF